MTAWRVIEAGGRCRLGESPLWSTREQALYWVDILSGAVHRLQVSDGWVSHWTLPDFMGWVIERRHAPGFVAGLRRDVVLMTLEPLAITPIVRPQDHWPDNRLNDAKADAYGRLWFGTMPMAANVDNGSLFRLDPDGTLTEWDTGYRVSNGPAFSPDGHYLYHTDSIQGVIYRFALHADGSISERESFIRIDDAIGKPDGMTVDAHGGLWIAIWGGSRICRYRADGVFDRAIALPASQITSCTFGGERLDRLYVTSAAEGVEEPLAGALFEVDPGIQGLPAHQFAG